MRDVIEMIEPRADSDDVPACASCANCHSVMPLTCSLLRDANGAPSRCAEQRTPEGRCGEAGVYWRAAVPGETGQIILFPGERRLPRAGGFDGGHAA